MTTQHGAARTDADAQRTAAGVAEGKLGALEALRKAAREEADTLRLAVGVAEGQRNELQTQHGAARTDADTQRTAVGAAKRQRDALQMQLTTIGLRIDSAVARSRVVLEDAPLVAAEVTGGGCDSISCR